MRSYPIGWQHIQSGSRHNRNGVEPPKFAWCSEADSAAQHVLESIRGSAPCTRTCMAHAASISELRQGHAGGSLHNRATCELGAQTSAASRLARKLGEVMSVNTFWTILLIIHGLLAVALLGALTHQAMAVLMPVRQAARQLRRPLPRGAGRGLRHCGLHPVGDDLHHGRVDLHQVPHLHPHPDRAGGLSGRRKASSS